MPWPVELSQLANLYSQPDLPTNIFHCQIFFQSNLKMAVWGKIAP